MVISKVAVFGGGTMGRYIAEALASSGICVTIIDLERCKLIETLKGISSNIDNEIKKWAITPSEKKVILNRIAVETDPRLARDCQFLIEAIPDNFSEKEKLFAMLDDLYPPELIFATNTSTLSVTRLCSSINRQSNFIGLHFIYPVHNNKIVEIIAGKKTSEETCRAAEDLIISIGKVPIIIKNTDRPITSRAIMPLINEAIYLVQEGMDISEIDKAIKLGYNFSVGPLELADRIGLDELEARFAHMNMEFGSRFAPCPLLETMVKKGELGIKTGAGFYKY